MSYIEQVQKKIAKMKNKRDEVLKLFEDALYDSTLEELDEKLYLIDVRIDALKSELEYFLEHGKVFEW